MHLQPLRMCHITRPMVRANFSHTFEIPDLKLPIHNTSFMALRLRQMQLSAKTGYNPVLKTKLECGSMPNVMAALPNIGGALCSMPQSLVDARYKTDVQ